MTVGVRRTHIRLEPNPARVLMRPLDLAGVDRVASVAARVMALPEEGVAPLLDEICTSFSARHDQLLPRFLERFEQVREMARIPENVTEERRLLIGACFLAEYSLEAAALFNPSIVPDPDQSDLPSGSLRFILSLRAVGEGHVSSITFRSGVISPGGGIKIADPSGSLTEARQIPNPEYESPLFRRKLSELGLNGKLASRVMDALGESFSLDNLRSTLDSEQSRAEELTQEDQAAIQGIWLLARSNHEVQFSPEQRLSERILFPATPSQRNGIEDARFVRFQKEDGSYVYYATFTAYDGKVVMPELVETADFLRFRFLTLNGPAAQNKGMALFPRKIAGQYAMLSRQDNENIYLMFSDNVHFWNERRILLKPVFPWEWIQIGNCGSPIETAAGWLVLSHGVGPLRQYSIGAFLLDLDDPSNVIGRLNEPLLKPTGGERDGYVPNVVYTCGALVHDGELVIPYGMADYATGFATLPVAELLRAMS
jgi:predicted GH43/DUF377 family glycosyl hydrolase